MLRESSDRDLVRKRVRFNVDASGAIEGDDGAGGNLAATLRYVCRMGSQIGSLMEIGELERLSTLGSRAVLARVGGTSPHLSIKAEVETRKTTRVHLAGASGIDVQEAIGRCLRRVTRDLASDWTALITDDRRLVGAMHYESGLPAADDTLLEVGIRALAVLGALDQPLRETAVRFDFVRGSVLIAAIGEHALFTHADKFEVLEVVTGSINAVQGVLAGVDLSRVHSITASRRV